MKKTNTRILAVILIIFSVITLSSCNKNKDNLTNEEILIGIAWRADTDSEFYTNVVRAIKEAGGTPVLLAQVYPNNYTLNNNSLAENYTDKQGILKLEYANEVKNLASNKSNAADVVSKVYAVVFTGGEDISPTLLRSPEPWHGIEEEKDYNATRDVSDYLTLAYCLEKDIPMMGMCRGMQMLSVVSGATIIQDIPTFFSEKAVKYDYTHRNQTQPGQYRDYAPHKVNLTKKKSLLYSIVSVDSIEGAPSWHHQCVGSVENTPLIVSGQTNTNGINIIEAVERPDKTFCIGLQFHPEAAMVKYLDKKDNASKFMNYNQALLFFKELVRQAKLKKNNR